MDKTTFAKELTILSTVFKEDLSKGMINIYYEMLKNYPDEQINYALNACLKTLKFFPKPAEIIEFIEGKEDEKILLWWEEVKEAITKYGAYESVAFENRIVNKVIESLGGWVALCSTLEDEMKWKQKDFERLYRAYERQDITKMPMYVMGIIEESNRVKGVEKTFTGLINGEKKLMQVRDFIKLPVKVNLEKSKEIGENQRKSVKINKKVPKSDQIFSLPLISFAFFSLFSHSNPLFNFSFSLDTIGLSNNYHL